MRIFKTINKYQHLFHIKQALMIEQVVRIIKVTMEHIKEEEIARVQVASIGGTMIIADKLVCFMNLITRIFFPRCMIYFWMELLVLSVRYLLKS